jgi:hypothetical protein
LIDEYVSPHPDPLPEGEGIEQEEMKVYDLKQEKDPKRFTLRYKGDLCFECRGERIEQIVRMTDFENKEAILRVYDVLDKM